ncbi:1-acyl-sn-glycerol-3-phosphate acyltransferase [Azoarcus sp. L1K30]|uniref:lysophospholipid acyltransferase family protein n=1 Tax=Azoarcus sp. L1K30 TaxID=2820277 RepID=UPI001B81EC60|nr:lysophospholipid acyltransferase family protein [Azoarcus sp. L1K30]MBR0564892.1 1-acyl-sn-glycerol-3-phosphate acyltransferase [Azoarcus sp. L1K30]
MIEKLFALLLCNFAKLLTGVRPLWQGCAPERRLRVYFANHRSHGDFVVVWAALPPALRRHTRPVAGADYWLKGGFKTWLITRVFNAVLIDRRPQQHGPNPVEQMADALRTNDSLILFPEGTRNLGEDLLPFKSGIYHLAKSMPQVEFVPVWIENLGRVMPKGAMVPVPLLCTLTFGCPLTLQPDETKSEFLDRTRGALLELAPPAN